MEHELLKYFANIIQCNVDDIPILDPYVLVFLLPTWTNRVTTNTKKIFKTNPLHVFEMDDLYPELSKLTGEDKEHALNIYRIELYTIHNIIEYYCDNMIDRNADFSCIYKDMMINTCSMSIAIMEEYVNINDRGIVYYVPYSILIDDLVNERNINPFTDEPYSSAVYSGMRKKYSLEIKLIC